MERCLEGRQYTLLDRPFFFFLARLNFRIIIMVIERSCPQLGEEEEQFF